MKRISLIANSSLQYYKFESEIDLNFGKANKFYFHEPFDVLSLGFILDPLTKIGNEDRFYRNQDLVDNDLLVNGKIKHGADLSSLKNIDSYFDETNLKRTFKRFQKKWIPLPYFKDNSINKDTLFPTDWVRIYFEVDTDFRLAKIVLAVDTLLAKDELDKTSPLLSLNPDENIFKLYTDHLNLSKFLFSKESSTAWINSYLEDIFYQNDEEERYEKPIKQYASAYFLLIDWLASLAEVPEIQLFTNDVRKKEVDLVVDIGNSATCALLFENENDNSFDFNSVKKLKIQDYTNPNDQYDKPFPMNLIFSDSKFGSLNNEVYHNNKFIVPSFVRIGYEAEYLINKSVTDLSLGYELKTYNSSPKRYLWDDVIADREWEFNPIKSNEVKKVYLNGISEQLKSDGSSIERGGLFGSKALFSRKSLMKFVFLEMIMHAYVQINSFEFREEHGDMTVPRTLRRITVSCPTGMIQHEQIALRQAAEDACKLLNTYIKFYFDDEINNFWFEMPEIIPSIKDLALKQSRIEERKDWHYDEATSSQLVFIYSLLAKKLKNNSYVLDHYLFKNRDSIVVGSIDIGAGTTDLSINRYTFSADQDLESIKPVPVFWDTFKNAGDDLLKAIIQKIIIEGVVKDGNDESCTGVIENILKSKGITNVSEKLNGFFGEDSNLLGYKGQVIRKAFIHQVAIPIALEYLNNANTNEAPFKTFEEIIGKPFINKELVTYFERHFGFSFLDIKWKLSPQKVNEIVGSIFDSLIRQLSVLLNHYQCDYVVLSGKPASLKSFEDIFRKYLTTSPNNIINLNNYWIGRWYPFTDNNGFIDDPKTIVGVGSIIALMSGKLIKLKDIKIDTSRLAKNNVSTADYLVKNIENTKEVLLTPTNNENTLIIKNLPYQFGYSKFETKNYPYSDLYTIKINRKEIETIVKQRYAGRDAQYLKNQVDVEVNSINQNLPLKIVISRDYEESKEIVKIESVEDADGNNKSIKYFTLGYQTLPSIGGDYWLDTCEFTLNVN